jgi:hypothetical protein
MAGVAVVGRASDGVTGAVSYPGGGGWAQARRSSGLAFQGRNRSSAFPGNCTSRPSSAYTSTGSGHGHTMTTGDHRPRSLLAPGSQTRRGGISHIQQGTAKSCPATGRRQQRDRQRAKPDTRSRWSSNQAANIPPAVCPLWEPPAFFLVTTGPRIVRSA